MNKAQIDTAIRSNLRREFHNNGRLTWKFYDKMQRKHGVNAHQRAIELGLLPEGTPEPVMPESLKGPKPVGAANIGYDAGGPIWLVEYSDGSFLIDLWYQRRHCGFSNWGTLRNPERLAAAIEARNEGIANTPKHKAAPGG